MRTYIHTCPASEIISCIIDLLYSNKRWNNQVWLLLSTKITPLSLLHPNTHITCLCIAAVVLLGKPGQFPSQTLKSTQKKYCSTTLSCCKGDAVQLFSTVCFWGLLDYLQCFKGCAKDWHDIFITMTWQTWRRAYACLWQLLLTNSINQIENM